MSAGHNVPSHTGLELVAYVDGASRGNPGKASYGVVIQDAKGNTVETLSEYLGLATNNVAEYRALLAALEYAVERQVPRVKIYCDSELVAKQMQGKYRVQSPDLKPLFERARKLAAEIGSFSIHHVPREQNRQADLLANKALDSASSSHHITEQGPPQSGSSAPPTSQNAPTSSEVQAFCAVVESGKLRPLAPFPDLEEGSEYEVRARKR